MSTVGARRGTLVSVGVAVVLAAGACGGSSTSSSSATTSPAVNGPQVSIANFAFAPQTLTVKVGTTVTWTNHDGVVHNIRWQTGGLPASPNLTPGTAKAVYSQRFTTAGTYSYVCGIHPNMTGTVIVTP